MEEKVVTFDVQKAVTSCISNNTINLPFESAAIYFTLKPHGPTMTNVTCSPHTFASLQEDQVVWQSVSAAARQIDGATMSIPRQEDEPLGWVKEG